MADLQPTHSSRDPSGQNYPAPVWDDVLWVLLGSAMLVYNGCLGLTCFLFAFKGRQLPDLYKNASLITVSMMLFMVIWIIFLPLYLTMSGKYKPAIEGAAILTSCFSILFSHLAPKCLLSCSGKSLTKRAPSLSTFGSIMSGRVYLWLAHNTDLQRNKSWVHVRFPGSLWEDCLFTSLANELPQGQYTLF